MQATRKSCHSHEVWQRQSGLHTRRESLRFWGTRAEMHASGWSRRCLGRFALARRLRCVGPKTGSRSQRRTVTLCAKSIRSALVWFLRPCIRIVLGFLPVFCTILQPSTAGTCSWYWQLLLSIMRTCDDDCGTSACRPLSSPGPKKPIALGLPAPTSRPFIQLSHLSERRVFPS